MSDAVISSWAAHVPEGPWRDQAAAWSAAKSDGWDGRQMANRRKPNFLIGSSQVCAFQKFHRIVLYGRCFYRTNKNPPPLLPSGHRHYRQSREWWSFTSKRPKAEECIKRWQGLNRQASESKPIRMEEEKKQDFKAIRSNASFSTCFPRKTS